MSRWVFVLCVAGLISAAPTFASAQQGWPQDEPRAQQAPEKRAQSTRSRAPQPELDEEDQLSPRQLDQRPPARPARRTQPPPDQDAAPPDQAAPPAAARPAEPARAIACNGVFGKESSHLKLATRFDSRNIVFTAVDGPEGSKLMASVLFPNDPRRRLEVLWQNEAARSDTHLIVINGKSAWTAPKGLHLGLPLAAVEKLNGKPFKMAGFDQPNGGSVTDWQGGALDKLSGGCRLGVRLVADAKASEAARNEALGNEFTSNDAKMRAVRPIIAEIILGY